MRRLISALSLQCVLLVATVAPAAHAAILFDAGSGASAVAVPMNRLPTWVQVANASAPLYTADAPNGAVASKIAKFTFLRVLGGGASRLQVNVYDETGSETSGGWVDVSDVLPSAPGTDWLVTSTKASLFNTAEPGAQVQSTIDRFSALQQIDGPLQDRIQVRVYRPDFTLLDQGWIDLAATGPAYAPQARVASPTPDRTLALRTLTANNQQAFLDVTAAAARDAAFQTGVPASVTVAQAILESDWGRSQLAQAANNYFGIKATSSLGNDGLIWLPTSEYDDSGQLQEPDRFDDRPRPTAADQPLRAGDARGQRSQAVRPAVVRRGVQHRSRVRGQARLAHGPLRPVSARRLARCDANHT